MAAQRVAVDCLVLVGNTEDAVNEAQSAAFELLFNQGFFPWAPQERGQDMEGTSPIPGTILQPVVALRGLVKDDQVNFQPGGRLEIVENRKVTGRLFASPDQEEARQEAEAYANYLSANGAHSVLLDGDFDSVNGSWFSIALPIGKETPVEVIEEYRTVVVPGETVVYEEWFPIGPTIIYEPLLVVW